MNLLKKHSKKIFILTTFLVSMTLIILLLYYFQDSPISIKDEAPKHIRTENVVNDSIRLSERAKKLAEVEVVPVVRKFEPFERRLYGRVDYDETKLGHITAWVPGRIEKLYVNFTGINVKKGDPMLDYYSPDLVVAQEELIQSLKSFHELKNTSTSFAKDQSERNLDSSRAKLRLLGIDNAQIKEMEESGIVKDVILVKTPASGVVIHKNALEGEYVKEGTEMFTIANLDNVWVQLEAYESDLPGLELGQMVQFKTDAFTDEIFTGRINFIDPFLNEKNRTTSFRVDVNNSHWKLKPGMYVTGVVKSYITGEGEIVNDIPSRKSPPIVIPTSAPLITGKRAIVYVQNPQSPFEYTLREVELGPKVGDYYIVSSGLSEGELVVVKGNFKIDSASQIEAKPSMMDPEGSAKPMKGHGHP